MKNKNLNEAKRNKNDEFYTMYEDIHNELKHYKDQFKGKKIYCNCDNENSNFVKYLKDKKEEYGIEAIVHYDGDFRSNGSIQLLEQSDIVITNPPFSLFRDFLGQLMIFNKKFLIIGSLLAVKNKDMFPLFKNNEVKIGYKQGSMSFNTPNDGIKKFGNIIWYTNLEMSKDKELIEVKNLEKEYNKDNYPKYENYKAINVNRLKDIPKDYFKPMGVPITYLTKHNSKDFNILDKINPILEGKAIYERIIINIKGENNGK